MSARADESITERNCDEQRPTRTASPTSLLRAGIASVSGELADRYRLLKVLLRTPENEKVRLRDALSPWFARLFGALPVVRRVDRHVRRVLFERDLRLLNDILNGTALADRYWVWGGLLLGWAREGRVLAHDLTDADFAYLSSDEARLQATIPLLELHGFRRGFAFESNRGYVTEHTFIRHGARFEFFAMESQERDWEYSLYGPEESALIELRARVPRQELEPFSFIGKNWLKVRDHQRELEVLYGNWRVPDTAWHYLALGGVVGREPWTGRPTNRPTNNDAASTRPLHLPNNYRRLQRMNVWMHRAGLVGR